VLLCGARERKQLKALLERVRFAHCSSTLPQQKRIGGLRLIVYYAIMPATVVMWIDRIVLPIIKHPIEGFHGKSSIVIPHSRDG
jgi:hypothetical protein